MEALDVVQLSMYSIRASFSSRAGDQHVSSHIILPLLPIRALYQMPNTDARMPCNAVNA